MEVKSLPGRDPLQPSHEMGALGGSFTFRDKNLGIINGHVIVTILKSQPITDSVASSYMPVFPSLSHLCLSFTVKLVHPRTCKNVVDKSTFSYTYGK